MPRRNSATLCLLAALALAGTAAMAGEPRSDEAANGQVPIRGVVELFTSQGCSSCPPADELFKAYTGRPDVIALSLPVDYWDYLGWKDTLASPKFTDRQRAYAKARGDGAIYTPQVIVDGVRHVVGSEKAEIDKAIEQAWPRFTSLQVPVKSSVQGGTVLIETGGAPDGKPMKEATVWLAVVQKKADVVVQRGENKGKTLTYTNVVREIAPVGLWQGKPLMLKLSRAAIVPADAEGCAVLIQQGDGGPIIGAAWLGL
jgi:hypothetical protein